MRKHISIFTLLLSVVFAVGAVGVAHAASGGERILANYVSRNGVWDPDDHTCIDPDYKELNNDRTKSQVFTAVVPTGYEVTRWLWNDDSQAVVRGGEASMTQIAGAQPTCMINYKGDGNRALGIRFDYIKFDVTFNGNGATSGSTASITGKDIDSPSFSLTANGFKKTGYHFTGWENDLGTTFNDKASVNGASFWDAATWKFHSALSAVWAANTYTVTFNGNGGSSPNSKSVTYDSTYGTLPTPTWTGYAFAGWFTDATAGTKVTADAKVQITADQTLYAHWTADGYTVTFNANGGNTPSPTAKSVTYGSTYGDLATCSRTGYSFDGWYTAASGGTKIESTTTVGITANQTLYAHWTPISYTITYNDVMEGSTHSNPGNYTIETEVTFSPATDPSGYVFNGWNPQSIKKGSKGDLTVRASYLRIVGKPDVHSPLTYTGYSQSCATLPDGVTGQGYQAKDVGTHIATFKPTSGCCWEDGTKDPYVVEWKITAAGITDATVEQTGTLTYTGEPQRPTVYASATIIGSQPTWKYSLTSGGYVEELPEFTDAGDYTVYFEVSAPNYEPATGSFTVTVKRAREATAVVSPTHLPYTKREQGPTVTLQHCHETEGSVKRAMDVGTYAVKAVPDGNYAWGDGEIGEKTFEWSIDDSLYTVQFDANGGTGEMASTNLAYNEEYIVPECDFTKTGCEFQFWQVIIDNRTVTNYPAGTVVSNLTTVANKNVTFKANWTGYYTIAFDGNGGEGEMASTNVERDVGCQLPSNAFTRTGYNFAMWTTNLPPNEKSLIADGATVTNLAAAGETCTLHAFWDAHHYTVTFNKNGGTGSVPGERELAYDEPMTVPASSLTPPLHHEFTGWGMDPKQETGTYQPGESVSNLTEVADGHVTLYAIWKFIPSEISKALDIDDPDNLYFESNKDASVYWVVDTEKGCPEDTSNSCMMHPNGVGRIFANAESSGTLTFWWMGQYEKGDPWAGDEDRWTTLFLECNGETTEFNCLESLSLKWQKMEVRIESASTVAFSHNDNLPCWVDHVTWTPDGGGEPTPGDPVEVKSAGVEGDVFSLTIPTVGGTDYGVWTNADLTVDSWGLMGEPKKGDDNPWKVEWTILPGFPQLFFRAHKVVYK